MMLFSWLVWNGSDLKYFFAVIPLLCLVFISELYRKSAQPFTNIAYTLAGIAYITLPLLSIIIVALGIDLGSDIPYNAGMVFGTIFILWSSDTGAYMLGSWLGKHRLFERISPKKSWEGFFGGALFSLIAGYLMWRFFESVGLYDWLIIALIVVITGTFGDLVESMFKRSLKVKDSGTFFPGHGGILDRFDGLFISAPFVMLYLLLFCGK